MLLRGVKKMNECRLCRLLKMKKTNVYHTDNVLKIIDDPNKKEGQEYNIISIAKEHGTDIMQVDKVLLEYMLIGLAKELGIKGYKLITKKEGGHYHSILTKSKK